MGWGVYKAPDGKYAIWSTIVDDFVYYDCDADDIRDIWREEFGRSGMHDCDLELDYADGARRRPHLGTPETFATRLAERDRRHGRKPADPEDVEYGQWLAAMREQVRQASRSAAT